MANISSFEHAGLVARPVLQGGQLTDIELQHGGRSLVMLGSGGPARELGILEGMEHWLAPASGGVQPVLPVLLGAGAGFALERLAACLEDQFGPSFSLVVVEKETAITQASGTRAKFARYPGIAWVAAQDAGEALRHITAVQAASGNIPLRAVVNPFYLRIGREYYNTVQEACAASSRVNFWERARYAKFTGTTPRILLMTSSYFLIGEVEAASKRLGFETCLLQIGDSEVGRSDFVEELLRAVVSFKPDFVLTLNHLGVDREGVLIDLLEQLNLPLASWFVDNPHLILHAYDRMVSPWVTLFTWDRDNIPSLRALGHEHVEYLSLGTDHHRFMPLAARKKAGLSCACPREWQADVSFVGNSMVIKVEKRMEAGAFPPVLLNRYKQVAAEFSGSENRSVVDFLQGHFPDESKAYAALDSLERKLCYEAMLTWEATLQYRLSCVEATLPFHPLIAGDPGWHTLLPEGGSWRHISELNYYSDLPLFYTQAKVNFNCTSKQMKGAVNQRVFDVPASGAFLITDYREQVEYLFEPGTEIICYHSPEEASEKIRWYLAHPAEREKVAQAALRRILAEHTYDHRMRTIVADMRRFYG